MSSTDSGHPRQRIPTRVLSLDDLNCTRHAVKRHHRSITLRVADIEADGDSGHVLVFGEIGAGCLVRIHSRCLYGDSIGIEDCDCGQEMHETMDRIQVEGRGVVICLDQEGRGAGLEAKARGLGLSQQSGLDTYHSYERLGLPVDSRSYVLAAAALRDLGLSSVRLLTNNPDKAAAVRSAGIGVTQTALHVIPPNGSVHRYLDEQREYRGHRQPRSWMMMRMVYGGVDLSLVALVVIATLLCVDLVTPGFTTPEGWLVPALVGILVWDWSWKQTHVLRARMRLAVIRKYQVMRHYLVARCRTRPLRIDTTGAVDVRSDDDPDTCTSQLCRSCARRISVSAPRVARSTHTLVAYRWDNR